MNSSAKMRHYDSSLLFRIARQAADSIQAKPRAGGQPQALVSLVFSVFTVEGFLNEITETARGFSSWPSEPQATAMFAECMADAERSPLESKLALANWVLASKKLNRGEQPYQDFSLMTDLRNRLAHFKGNKYFTAETTPKEFHKDLIKQFGARKLLADDMRSGSWIQVIETKAIANWCCKTSARMIVDLVSKIPAGVLSNFAQGLLWRYKPHA